MKVVKLFVIILLSYIFIALALTKILLLDIPVYLNTLFQIIIAPLFFIFRPLYPLLERLGLMEGEYWSIPTFWGMMFGVVLYAVPLYFVVLLVSFNKNKT